MMLLSLFFILIFSVCFLLTGFLCRNMLAGNLLDNPNHRSSHQIPTPRGGGISFVAGFLVTVLGMSILKLIPYSLFFALFGAGLLVAFVGFLDDYQSLPAKWRLLGHFIAAAFALIVLGGMPAISFFYWTLPVGLISNILGLFYLVWLLNLYNFMDGIDGIAAVEAITVCLGAVILYFLQDEFSATLLPGFLLVAVGGFLLWNLPPARIFMGDSGSGFLGITLGLLSIQAAWINVNFFWSWLVLLGVFIVDATVTLIRRVMLGKALSEAHRTHAYQYASRYYQKHLPVTLGVLSINLLWLLPMAIAIGFNLINNVAGLIIAYIPLIGLAFKFNAGKTE